MKLFGFEINRKDEDKQQEKIVSFAPPTNDDGAITVASGGIYGTYVDLDGSVRNEAELVNKYRAISLDPIIDLAIQDICNEAIVEDSNESTVSIILEDIKTQESIKKKITEEFNNILNLLEFNRMSYEVFKRWYVDGRLYYHVIIDDSKPKKGILEVRYIDPRNIKKVKEVKKEKDAATGVTIEKLVSEYYIYNQTGFVKRAGNVTSYGGAGSATQAEGVKISKDSIVYCTSGYMNSDNNLILSHLHKALRPLNQLRSMEDSLVIYRISRAPERRIFYVDVGGLPKAKAEQYVNDLMTKFKNKVVYDSSSGEIRDDRKFMTMLEDFWLPRREGGRGTEISTLPGGQNLGEIEDVTYFQGLLYRSLNVPVTRLQPESAYSLGRATEISRDEVKFSKFITRLRSKFGELFTSLLERQLILKGICTVDEWKEWKHLVNYDYAIDNYFDELKNLEMNRDRIGLLREMEEYIGKYYSHEYIRRHVLQQNEVEMNEIDETIKSEKTDQRYSEIDDEDNEDTDTSPPPSPAPESQQSYKLVPDDEKEKRNDEKEGTKTEEIDVLTQSQIQLIESMTKYIEND